MSAFALSFLQLTPGTGVYANRAYGLMMKLPVAHAIVGQALADAVLTSAYLSLADLAYANLSDGELYKADLTSADLDEATISQRQLDQVYSCKGATLSKGLTYPHYR